MALSDFQREICQLVARNRLQGGESYLAGAAALNELVGAPRLSRDLDVFHDTEEALAVSWQADRAVFEEAGYEVRVFRERQAHARDRPSNGRGRATVGHQASVPCRGSGAQRGGRRHRHRPGARRVAGPGGRTGMANPGVAEHDRDFDGMRDGDRVDLRVLPGQTSGGIGSRRRASIRMTVRCRARRRPIVWTVVLLACFDGIGSAQPRQSSVSPADMVDPGHVMLPPQAGGWALELSL